MENKEVKIPEDIIPEDIKNKIKAEAMRLYPHDDESNKIDRDRFLDGARFGYVLGCNAIELIEDLLHKSELACEQYSKENRELYSDLKAITTLYENSGRYTVIVSETRHPNNHNRNRLKEVFRLESDYKDKLKSEDAIKIIKSVSSAYETPSVASHFMELGYSIAQSELQSLRQEVERLKWLIEKAWYQATDNVCIEHGMYDKDEFEENEQPVYKSLKQFKSQNNL